MDICSQHNKSTICGAGEFHISDFSIILFKTGNFDLKLPNETLFHIFFFS